jgi:hypothetical protein
MEPLTEHTVLKESDHPKIVYKYRDWRNKYHRRILTQQEIFLSSPSEFNDPFDCRIPESFSMLNTDEKLDKYFKEFVIRNIDYLNANRINIPKYIAFLKKDLKENTAFYQKNLNQRYLKDGDLYFGIFCTTKVWNNILMWAHYSSNHSGFCVGLNREILYDYHLTNATAASVIYRKTFPLIDPFDDFIQKMFQKSHSKANNWRYEKEYRFYLNTYPNKLTIKKRKIKIKKECFNCIMIGLTFPENQIPFIKKLANSLDVPLYQIYTADQTFRLKRKKIILP